MTLTTLAQTESPNTVVDEAFSFVQALPIEAHAAMGIMLLVGLGLWLFGGKIIKPLFGIAGLVLGGTVGLIALPAFGIDHVAGAPSAMIGMASGAIIGLVVSLMMLKAAIVFTAGLGFAAVGFLGGTIYLSHNSLPDDQPPPFVIDDTERASNGRLLFENPMTGERMTIEELTRSLREADSFLSGSKKDPALPAGEEVESEAFDPELAEGKTAVLDEERLRAIAVRCEAIMREGLDMAKSHWNALSSRERMVVVGSTFGSLAFGLLIGFIFPKKATAFITALAGSAIWLTAAGLLIDTFVPSLRNVTDQPPAVWAGIWAFAFLLGLVVQLAGLGGPARPKKKKKSKPEEDEEEEDDEEE